MRVNICYRSKELSIPRNDDNCFVSAALSAALKKIGADKHGREHQLSWRKVGDENRVVGFPDIGAMDADQDVMFAIVVGLRPGLLGRFFELPSISVSKWAKLCQHFGDEISRVLSCSFGVRVCFDHSAGRNTQLEEALGHRHTFSDPLIWLSKR